ncbi:hypothetical protein BJY01DRAFT_205990 [Aspergillus pseudoustus]|uniref:Amino acid permease/ SLC12A domain-containing protein n=1 Tax=Aspergillus pseudoustus TaxID=1810923 RepID=A0ABR4KNM2_9EURO
MFSIRKPQTANPSLILGSIIQVGSPLSVSFWAFLLHLCCCEVRYDTDAITDPAGLV